MQTTLALPDTQPTLADATDEAQRIITALDRLNGDGGALDLIADVSRRLPHGQHRGDIENAERELFDLLEKAADVAGRLKRNIEWAGKWNANAVSK